MKEQLISFDTAKLAKEKGFVYNTEWSYDGETLTSYSFIPDHPANTSDDYPAPTQSLLQKWLREKYGLIVTVYYVGLEYNAQLQWKTDSDPLEYDEVNSNLYFHEHWEDALEAGLVEALKLIGK